MNAKLWNSVIVNCYYCFLMTTEDYIRSEQHGKSKGKKEIWMKHMLAGPTVNMNQNFLPCVKFSNTANIYFHFWGGHCLLFMHLDNYFKAGCHWRIAPVYITSLRQLEAVFTCYGPRIVVFSLPLLEFDLWVFLCDRV